MTPSYDRRPDMAAVERAVRVLNEALLLDREAIEKLFAFRVNVNQELGAHPTIQVASAHPGAQGLTLGAIGLINGLFGADAESWGFICMDVDDNDHTKILRFSVRNPSGSVDTAP